MILKDERDMPGDAFQARAATPSGLSQSSLASCQHRIDYRKDEFAMKRVLALIPCAICGGELDNPFGTPNQPSGAVEFTSHGHYGTTVFDPMDGSALALNICDGCVLELRRQQRIGIYRQRKFKKWNR